MFILSSDSFVYLLWFLFLFFSGCCHFHLGARLILILDLLGFIMSFILLYVTNSIVLDLFHFFSHFEYFLCVAKNEERYQISKRFSIESYSLSFYISRNETRRRRKKNQMHVEKKKQKQKRRESLFLSRSEMITK